MKHIGMRPYLKNQQVLNSNSEMRTSIKLSCLAKIRFFSLTIAQMWIKSWLKKFGISLKALIHSQTS